jgi:hypothetical protein
MPSIRRIFVGVSLLIAGGLVDTAVHAAPVETSREVRLMPTSRIYVTLVPRSADPDDGTRWINGVPTVQPSLNLSIRTSRRNRLEFALTRRDLISEGDQLRLRLASDAHIVAQLLSGGAFSEVDDTWIAVLGLASRMRLSYNNGPWEFSLSARHRFGDGAVRARLTYGFRF